MISRGKAVCLRSDNLPAARTDYPGRMALSWVLYEILTIAGSRQNHHLVMGGIDSEFKGQDMLVA